MVLLLRAEERAGLAVHLDEGFPAGVTLGVVHHVDTLHHYVLCELVQERENVFHLEKRWLII